MKHYSKQILSSVVGAASIAILLSGSTVAFAQESWQTVSGAEHSSKRLEQRSPRLRAGDTKPPGWYTGFGNREGDERGHRIPVPPSTVSDAATSPAVAASAGGLLSITFDDGSASQAQIPIPILAQAGLTATYYINSGLVGTQDYMNWQQLTTLARAGNEIGGHTAHHIELPTVSQAELTAEVNQDRAALAAHGLHVTDFATPFGAYDNNTIATVAKVYNSHRAFANQGLNLWPYNKYLLNVHYVTNTTSVAQAKAWVDEAVAQDGYLVLVFHEVLNTVDPTDDYSWQTENFKDLVSYIKTKGIPVKTVAQALASKQNLLQNGSFESGFAGWSTDNASSVTVEGGNHGSYPMPAHAVKMTGAATAVHLFGTKVPVAYGTTYGWRTYVDGRTMNSGEVGFYVDEYDSAGTWVSGRWFGAMYSANTMDYAFRYTPSSSNVASAAVQVYATAGTQGSAYLDNLELVPR